MADPQAAKPNQLRNLQAKFSTWRTYLASKPKSSHLITGGFLAILLGAVDPMEGSLIILAGSAMVAMGTALRKDDRRLVAFRAYAFAMIALGVAALWGLSMIGGIGGKSDLSLWWGVTVFPYLIGWSASVWGPGSPRWVAKAGIAVGVLYLWIVVMILWNQDKKHEDSAMAIGIVIAVLGILTITGCIVRLTKRSDAKYLAT